MTPAQRYIRLQMRVTDLEMSADLLRKEMDALWSIFDAADCALMKETYPAFQHVKLKVGVR